jgi:hypothetical protein
MKNTYVTRLQVLTVVIAIVTASATTLHAQKYTDLYNLGSSSGDPANPGWTGLFAQGRDGNLYSTSQGGGNICPRYRLSTHPRREDYSLELRWQRH